MARIAGPQFNNFADYDCIITAIFPDVENFVRMKADPYYKEKVAPDHENFADTKRSRYGAYALPSCEYIKLMHAACPLDGLRITFAMGERQIRESRRGQGELLLQKIKCYRVVILVYELMMFKLGFMTVEVVFDARLSRVLAVKAPGGGCKTREKSRLDRDASTPNMC